MDPERKNASRISPLVDILLRFDNKVKSFLEIVLNSSFTFEENDMCFLAIYVAFPALLESF